MKGCKFAKLLLKIFLRLQINCCIIYFNIQNHFNKINKQSFKKIIKTKTFYINNKVINNKVKNFLILTKNLLIKFKNTNIFTKFNY